MDSRDAAINGSLSPHGLELSRGRLVPEPETAAAHALRARPGPDHPFPAFRRLKHKTQVFVYHEGDHYRTRLTHSIEVAQVARSIARALGLDEDLTEALALAHDLGHTPFGHAGERELDRLMKPYGGFDHNAQSLRIVTRLERRYADFDGLNLTWETLEGLVKHNGPLIDAEGDPRGPLPRTGTARGHHRICRRCMTSKLALHPSAEAQVAAISDDIAYNAHDIDDGLRAGLFGVIDLGDVPLAGEALSDVLRRYPGLEHPAHRARNGAPGDFRHDCRRDRGNPQPGAGCGRHVGRRGSASGQAAGRVRPADGREQPDPAIIPLRQRMYRHAQVDEIMGRAQRVVRDLFEAYMDDPEPAAAELAGRFLHR